MANYGQTANGVAHFAPMMRLEAPQLNIGNPFKDYIAKAIAERELELKEKGLGLQEKGLGLDEQKLAYNAANDEANRGHAIELEMLKGKNAKDYLKQELSLRNSYANKARAEKKLEDDRIEEVRRYIGKIHNDVLKSGQDIGKAELTNMLENHLRINTDFENRYIDKVIGSENYVENFMKTQSGSGTKKGKFSY